MERVAPGDRAEFRALVDELADLESRRSGEGAYSPDDAVRRQQIERRLLQLVTTEIPQDERRRHVRLPCDLSVTIHGPAEPAPGVVVDVGAGGIFVESGALAKPGDTVDIEIQRPPDAALHSLRVKGKVAWATTTRRTGRPGLGIAFLPATGSAADEAGERRLRRFVLSLLRKRLPDA